MLFPIQFSRNTENYDLGTAIAHFLGNSTLVAGIFAVSGIAFGIIAYLAFQVFGRERVPAKIAALIPLSIGSIGVSIGLIGLAALIPFSIAMAKIFSRR